MDAVEMLVSAGGAATICFVVWFFYLSEGVRAGDKQAAAEDFATASGAGARVEYAAVARAEPPIRVGTKYAEAGMRPGRSSAGSSGSSCAASRPSFGERARFARRVALGFNLG